ncbi:cupin domain-containing protein [Phenylobacterium sp.]|jgi:quercetin dioxygenase-like cupin family protein|uniref:cupin domain-containing protein n=1 Tax=Phenylobacterium sp. TaxID=1871053 RepID=UPI002F3EFFB6
MRLRTALLATALAAALAGFAAPAAAQAIMTREIPNAGGLQMTEVKVTLAPGQIGHPHHHGGFLVAYVLKGTVVSQVEGEPEHTWHVGDSWIENPGAHHVVSRNGSATEPAEFLVVFVAPKGTVLTTPDP